MPVSLSRYRNSVGGFHSQCVPYKQYNFFYSDSFRKLNMPGVTNVSFLTFIYVLMKLLVPNGLPCICFYQERMLKISTHSQAEVYILDLNNINTLHLGLSNSDYSER